MDQAHTAIVTGAGSGIGRQTAIKLATAGWSLLLVSRTEKALRETMSLCQSSGEGQTSMCPADLTASDSAAHVIDQAMTRHGRIDALANVAGYAPMMPIEQIRPQVAQSCIDTNLTAVVNLTAAAWPNMVEQNSGVIVNVSSIASIDPFPGLSVYAAAKIGVNMFTRCTAQEGEPYGIRAVAIAPGAVETPMLRSILDEQTFPPDKALAPEEVATLICDCILGQRKFAPGETIQMPNP